jgi:hypothetical protein
MFIDMVGEPEGKRTVGRPRNKWGKYEIGLRAG